MKYTKEILTEAVSESNSVLGVLRFLGLTFAGGTHTHVSKRIKDFEIDTSHFTGQAWNRGRISQGRKSPGEILVKLPDGSARTKTPQLNRAMLESGVPYCCKICGHQGNWNEKSLVLVVDHEDGNWLDNRLDNLRFLCPNCNSQTPTFCRPKCSFVKLASVAQLEEVSLLESEG